MAFRRTSVSLALAACLVAAPALIAAPSLAAPPETDNQLWTELDLDAPLTSSLSLTGLAVLRAGESLPNPALAAAGGGLSYAITDHWSIAAGDYAVRVRSAVSGHALGLQLPLAAITYATRIDGFILTDRNRAEDIVGVPGEGWRYRNRLSVTHALDIGPVRSAFIADEVFYDVSRDGWSRNRAQLGVGLAPVGPADLQIYYLRQDDRFSHPGHLNVLGLALALSFGTRT